MPPSRNRRRICLWRAFGTQCVCSTTQSSLPCASHVPSASRLRLCSAVAIAAVMAMTVTGLMLALPHRRHACLRWRFNSNNCTLSILWLGLLARRLTSPLLCLTRRRHHHHRHRRHPLRPLTLRRISRLTLRRLSLKLHLHRSQHPIWTQMRCGRHWTRRGYYTSQSYSQ